MARKTDSRERLRACALNAFLGHGYAAVTAREVYTGCNLPQGTFSHFFPGGLRELGEEIFPALHDAIWSDVLALLERPARPRVTRAAQAKLAERLEADRGRTRLYFDLIDQLGPFTDGKPAAQRLIFGQDVVAAWLQADGRHEDLPAELACSIVFGHVLDAGRAWARGHCHIGPGCLVSAAPFETPVAGKKRPATKARERTPDLLARLLE